MFIYCKTFLLTKSQHMDVIFYYLRKKGKSSNYTTTDNAFDRCIQRLHTEMLSTPAQKFRILDPNNVVSQQILGKWTHRNKDWSEVENVLFPIHVQKQQHWVLGRLSIPDRCIYLYNSMRNRRNDIIVADCLKAYIDLLPYFLQYLMVFENNKSITVGHGAYEKGITQEPLELVMVGDLPMQESA